MFSKKTLRGKGTGEVEMKEKRFKTPLWSTIEIPAPRDNYIYSLTTIKNTRGKM